MVEQHFGGELASVVGVDSAGFAHETACETASAISGLWNGRVTSRYSSTGSNTRPPRTFFAQLGLVLVLLGHFHAERGQILRVAGEHIMRGGIGDCHGDRASAPETRLISASTWARVMSLTDSIGVASP